MDENVLRWITKITNAFAECSCGNKCHIDVTIRERDILFRAICPASVDLTDYIIEYVRRELKKPLESVTNCNE